ncbi:MAG: anti-sigma factor family protein [Spirochaetota bacterium]
MKCRTVQNRLSEYIDGRLPAGLERPIEEHCASCDTCAKELAFLRAYRTRMSSLPRKAAPADFPEKLKGRLDTPEPRRGIVRTLFHPARVKLPIEAAGLLAAAALVFVILLPDEARKADLQSRSGERVAVMDGGDMETRDIDDVAGPPARRRVLKTAPSVEKSIATRVYVIELSPRRASAPAIAMNEARRDRAGEHEEMKAADAYVSKAKVAAARQMPPTEQKKETADRLNEAGSPADIRAAVRRSGATIIEERCEEGTGRCSSFTLEVKENSYKALVDELKLLGDVRPLKAAPGAGGKTMRLRIQMEAD